MLHTLGDGSKVQLFTSEAGHKHLLNLPHSFRLPSEVPVLPQYINI